MKMQISINDELAARLDAYAEQNYLNRSGCITIALNQLLNAADVTNALKDLSLSMRKIADTGKVTDEQLEQLKDIERLAKMFAG